MEYMHSKPSYLKVRDMKRGNVAATVSLGGMPGFCETLCCGDKILSPQYAA